MRAIIYLLIAFLLTGASCTSLQRGKMPAQCEAICFIPCTDADGDTGVQWLSDSNTPQAWDDLGGDVLPELAKRVRQCEVSRTACVQCLRRLHRAEVIDLGAQGAETP